MVWLGGSSRINKWLPIEGLLLGIGWSQMRLKQDAGGSKSRCPSVLPATKRRWQVTWVTDSGLAVWKTQPSRGSGVSELRASAVEVLGPGFLHGYRAVGCLCGLPLRPESSTLPWQLPA